MKRWENRWLIAIPIGAVIALWIYVIEPAMKGAGG